MEQQKSFKNIIGDRLDSEVNGWLSKNDGKIEIVSRQTSTVAIGDEVHGSVFFFYKPKAEPAA